MSIFNRGRCWEWKRKNYAVDSIVEATKPVFQRHDAGFEPEYWLRLCDDSSKYDLQVHSLHPRFLIVSSEEDYYVIRELSEYYLEPVKVWRGWFELATRLVPTEVSEVKYANGDTACKTITPCEQSGIRKYKRAVKVCDENLAEIVNIPIVNAIIPLHAVFCEDDDAGFMTCALWQEKREGPKSGFATSWAVKCPLYELFIANGYFVQDACDGWRWLSDEDWEKHKDDLITE